MTTQHNNDVYFAITGVTSFQFEQSSSDSYAITSGQPWGGVTSGTSKSGAQAQITIAAGRKGSEAVATWFKNQVGSGQTIACDSKGNFPNDLNFAVMGNMTIGIGDDSYLCENVIIAQGHFTGANNWWMGSPNWQGAHISISGAAVQKTQTKGLIPTVAVFAPQTPCSNNFDISIIDAKKVL
ncbi:hypothetical protein G6O69_03440 [Pseudenhygromyxa sp. WMMC2535]|uniref:hypothetical protein n=1 Tax=Pseudenhygromyxa sp. WMMC2535 TaxID=2712867 RepID=UPI001554E97F|nr:hypothetical protein [Pseudenhygromyxa sp. WMMC2535]NVB36868.1 hypothetical protein [Pseudenhygromyxa sp. WMMC2535]